MAIALVTLLSLATAQAQDIIRDSVMVGGKKVAADYTKLSDTTVMLGTGQNACISQYVGGHLSIPGEITVGGTRYRVEEVGAMAFRLCTKITSVEIKENVKRVGNFAFVGCRSIKDITLPASLERIGTGAFQSCADSIESVTCLGATPAQWEYNDVFRFHAGGIGDTKPELITAGVGLYVPEGADEAYRQANYTNPNLGWNTADGWGSFNTLNLGQAVFHIYTPADLEILRDIVNYGNKFNTIRKTVLENDIDMSAYSWDKGIGFNEEEPFMGNFYGNGHMISNLRIANENGPGGLFAHFGGHEISNLTLYNCNIFGSGPTGALAGEAGYCTISNVWIENTSVVGGEHVGGMIGSCLTTGGANVYHSVVKDLKMATIKYDHSDMGGLIGKCYGGRARNCAIIGDLPDLVYIDMGLLTTDAVLPFVGLSEGNNDFYEENSYATSNFFARYTPKSFEKPDFDLVVSTKKTLEYIDTNNNTVSTTYNATTMKSLFLIPKLGLDEWIYAPDEYPLPQVFADRVPVQVNKATYCSAAVAQSRVNGLTPETLSPLAFLDLSPDGYLSEEYQVAQLWIDENFAFDPATAPQASHTPYLPIGTATIDARQGVRFDRTLEVVKDGIEPVQIPNTFLDENGYPQIDEFGDVAVDGTYTTLYYRPVYANAASCIYLPYPITINDGVRFFQPTDVSFNNQQAQVTMRQLSLDTTEPWQPYYLLLNDAPINLSNLSHVVVQPRPAVSELTFGDQGKCHMLGAARPTTSATPIHYGLSDFMTFTANNATVPAWTSFLTYDGGTADNTFTIKKELALYDAENNAEAIERFAQTKLDVCLSGRTFYKDDTWYTICLPFDLDYLRGTPLEGATLRYMTDSKVENGTLTIDFEEVQAIGAGIPYLIKWSHAPKVKNPVFKNVILKDMTLGGLTSGVVRFKGCFSPYLLFANDKNMLYLGENNQLFYPEEDMMVNSFRAFFQVKESLVQDPGTINRIMLNFDGVLTDIEDLRVDEPLFFDNGWYTIDGRRLTEKPSMPGIYINQGKKVLIK